jgi:hypothetical protein
MKYLNAPMIITHVCGVSIVVMMRANSRESNPSPTAILVYREGQGEAPPPWQGRSGACHEAGELRRVLFR